MISQSFLDVCAIRFTCNFLTTTWVCSDLFILIKVKPLLHSYLVVVVEVAEVEQQRLCRESLLTMSTGMLG